MMRHARLQGLSRNGPCIIPKAACRPRQHHETCPGRGEGVGQTFPLKAGWLFRNLQRSSSACTTGCCRASSASAMENLCRLMPRGLFSLSAVCKPQHVSAPVSGVQAAHRPALRHHTCQCQHVHVSERPPVCALCSEHDNLLNLPQSLL